METGSVDVLAGTVCFKTGFRDTKSLSEFCSSQLWFRCRKGSFWNGRKQQFIEHIARIAYPLCIRPNGHVLPYLCHAGGHLIFGTLHFHGTDPA